MIVPIATEAHHAAHIAPLLPFLPTRHPVRRNPRVQHGSLVYRRAEDDVALVASYGDYRKAKRRGFLRIVLAQHGAGQSYGGGPSHDHPSYPGGRDNDGVGLFLCPNEHSAERWRRRYPKAAVAVVGSPRLDELPARADGDGAPPTVAISFHWNGLFCPEVRSADRTFFPALPDLARAFHVLGHGHPLRRDLRRIYGRSRIEYVASFDDVCKRADVYVCDNSSTLFEFAATGRPVVVMNDRLYRRNVSHGLRFWDAADVGVQVSRADRLVAAVTEALEDAPERQANRDAAVGIVYAHRTGAAKRAAGAIRDWMGLPAEVAA